MWGSSGPVQLPDVQDTKIFVGSFALAFKPPISYLCHSLHANAETVTEHSGLLSSKWLQIHHSSIFLVSDAVILWFSCRMKTFATHLPFLMTYGKKLHSTTKPMDISCILWMNEMQNPHLQNPPDVRNSTTIINTMQLYRTCVQENVVCVRMSIPYITTLMMAIKLEKN